MAGCLGAYGSGSPDESESPTDDSPSRTETKHFTPAGPDRAEGEPVSVERTVTDEPGYDDDIEYFPSNRTVRFVEARSGDEPLSFGTWSFEEWGTFETAEVGLERARAATSERLGTNEIGSSVGVPPDTAALENVVIWLELSVQKDRDGNVTSTPTIPYSALVEAAPRSVHATVSVKGDEFSRTVPVFVRFSILQLL